MQTKHLDRVRCHGYAEDVTPVDAPVLLELYAGIGGVAATGARVVAGIDHDELAHTVYAANFSHPVLRKNLVSFPIDALKAFAATVWWLSPPCQPFTVRGQRRDVNDRRCESLLRLVDVMQIARPPVVMLENVPGFAGSLAESRVRGALAGYTITVEEHCPTALGVPMQRRRVYLVALRSDVVDQHGPFAPVWPEIPVQLRPLAGYLDEHPSEAMRLQPAFLDRFEDALHIVEADDPRALAACFTGAYGRSPVYAGSYLRREGVLYRFSPAEIARLMGFGDAFWLPDDVPRVTRKLGNAVSVDIARHLLAALPRAVRPLDVD